MASPPCTQHVCVSVPGGSLNARTGLSPKLCRPYRGGKPSKWYKEVSVDRNTATETLTLKYSREGKKPGRKHKVNDQQKRKPTETQGPCPDLRGFCIKALTEVATVRSKKLWRKSGRPAAQEPVAGMHTACKDTLRIRNQECKSHVQYILVAQRGSLSFGWRYFLQHYRMS